MTDERIEYKEGMRIHCFSPDKIDDYGYGTIIKIDKLIDEDGYVWSNSTPVIRLDSGKIMYGAFCWWYPIG